MRSMFPTTLLWCLAALPLLGGEQPWNPIAPVCGGTVMCSPPLAPTISITIPKTHQASGRWRGDEQVTFVGRRGGAASRLCIAIGPHFGLRNPGADVQIIHRQVGNLLLRWEFWTRHGAGRPVHYLQCMPPLPARAPRVVITVQGFDRQEMNRLLIIAETLRYGNDGPAQVAAMPNVPNAES